MTESPELTTLVDAGAFLSFESQLHFAELTGSVDQWDADLTVPVISFRTGGVTRVFDAQVLGSASTATWMASWANPSIRDGARVLSRELSEHARRESVRELASEQLKLGDWPDHDPIRTRLAIAAGVLRPEWRTYYAAPLGISHAMVMMRDPELELPAPAIPRVMRVIAEGVSYTRLHSMTDAVEAYAVGRGIPVEMSASKAVLTLPGGAVIVEFDPETARIVGVRGEAGGNSVQAPIAPAVGATAKKGWLSGLFGRRRSA
jgi:hypothetical protein